jgi:hypothetical protein
LMFSKEFLVDILYAILLPLIPSTQSIAPLSRPKFQYHSNTRCLAYLHISLRAVSDIDHFSHSC